jgi:hypothetical protein
MSSVKFHRTWLIGYLIFNAVLYFTQVQPNNSSVNFLFVFLFPALCPLLGLSLLPSLPGGSRHGNGLAHTHAIAHQQSGHSSLTPPSSIPSKDVMTTLIYLTLTSINMALPLLWVSIYLYLNIQVHPPLPPPYTMYLCMHCSYLLSMSIGITLLF